MVVLDILLIANLMYSRTYYCAIPLSSYGLVGNLSDFTASVSDSFRWIDTLFPLSSAVYVIMAIRNRSDSKLLTIDKLNYIIYIVVLNVFALACIAAKGGFSSHYAALNNANYHSCRVPVYTLVGQLIHDALESDAKLTDAQRDETARWIAHHKQLQALSTIKTDKQNLIVIICESLESWVIDKSIEGQEITPNINRYLRDSINCVYAPNVVSQVGNGRSIDGQLLVDAGMLPPYNKVYSIEYGQHCYYTLPKALHEKNGAYSYLLTVDKEDTWNQGVVARAFGIDTVLSRENWVNDEPVGSGRKKLGDRSFMRQIVAKMKAGEIMHSGDNNYIQIVTYSGHNPFVLPDSLNRLKLEGDYHEIMARYMALANYTDSGLGILLDYLRTRPDFDRTMIVITGDHEGLATYRDEVVKTSAGRGFVSERQLVPFIVINAPIDLRYDGVMGQVDIYPTLLQLMGMTDYSWTGFGFSIVNGNHPGVAVGSQGELQGDKSAVSTQILDHVNSARKMSERVICYDLLTTLLKSN